jgi:hypothetical protein
VHSQVSSSCSHRIPSYGADRLRAWIFATGLVLGFSLLVENGTTNSSEDERCQAFIKSLNVLDKLKRLSPQADRYHGILTNFSQAIDAYKEQRLRQRMQQSQRSSLVDRLFLPPTTPGFVHSQTYDDTLGAANTQLPTPADMPMEPSPSAWNTTDMVNISGLSDIMPGTDAGMNNGEGDIIMRMLWEGYGVEYPDIMLSSVDMPM